MSGDEVEEEDWVRSELELLRDREANAQELWELTFHTDDPELRADILDAATQREVGDARLWLEYIAALEKLGNAQDDIYGAMLMLLVHCDGLSEFEVARAIRACVRDAAPFQVSRALRTGFYHAEPSVRAAFLAAGLLAKRPEIVLELASQMGEDVGSDPDLLCQKGAYTSLAAAMKGDWDRAIRDWEGLSMVQDADSVGTDAAAASLLIALRRGVKLPRFPGQP